MATINAEYQEVTLGAFIVEEQKRIERFKAFWKMKNITDPQNFPLTMWVGDWHEQLDVFDQ